MNIIKKIKQNKVKKEILKEIHEQEVKLSNTTIPLEKTRIRVRIQNLQEKLYNFIITNNFKNR